MHAVSRRIAAFAVTPLAVVLFALAGLAHAADDDGGVANARAYCDALLKEMKTAKQTPVRRRYDELEPAIKKMFDLPTMTKNAVGRDWATMDPRDQQIITEGFTKFTIATYANRFDGYSGEHFEVDPTAETRGENRLVHTTLVKANGEKIPLNYLMHQTPDGWKAIDVYLNGTISELSTRRNEFSSILHSGGPTALVERLKEQTDRQLGS